MQTRVDLREADLVCARGKLHAAKASKKLKQLGVEVPLGAVVVDVDEYGIAVMDTDGSTCPIASCTKVWAAGVALSWPNIWPTRSVCWSTERVKYPCRTTVHCPG